MEGSMREEDKRLHYELGNVGLRAQATATGFIQLCAELRDAGVLGEEAIERIKDRIARDITLSAPRSLTPEAYKRDVRARLDRLFAGCETVGNADALSFGAQPH
jgi:hypothetical protein